MEGATSTKGVMPLDIMVGTITKTTVFFVIDGPTSYNVLLGRDWIHGNHRIPLSLHQCLVFWNGKGEVEVVQADHRPFVAEAISGERFMYEGNYGPVRVVQKGEETQIVTQSEESFSVDAFTEMFDQMRPNIVALEEPSNWQKDNKKMLKNMANSQAYKAKLVSFNKECKEKMKEDVAM
ncbi:Uncharacterized protein Adt_03128 [Abeliophyllum distichum]|uniref:Uncharacterized protein n=1 Tax=Abeliophyllum distichum TaxID=126358 RepID=A0ABD1W107_9LAMI